MCRLAGIPTVGDGRVDVHVNVNVFFLRVGVILASLDGEYAD